jgi:hypothetical protein
MLTKKGDELNHVPCPLWEMASNNQTPTFVNQTNVHLFNYINKLIEIK